MPLKFLIGLCNMKRVYKIFKQIVNVLCWILIAVLVATVVFSLVTRVRGDSPMIFGYSIFRVSSGSMEPELKVGDIILIKEAENPKDIKEGEIVTFDGVNELSGLTVSHQVYKAPFQDENGEWKLQTKGLANDYADTAIPLENVKGVFLCTVPFLTKVYEIFLSPWGLLVFILLMVVIFIDEIIVIVKILTGNEKTAKDAESIGDIIARIENEKSEGKEDNDENKEQ